ncbi:MAG: NADH-quinone oxidoreductase subunit C [Acidimicrobiales bacterium]
MSDTGAADTDAETDDSESTETGLTVEEAYGFPVTWSRGQRVIHPDRDAWRALAVELLADGWNMCVDLTAVDYLSLGGLREVPPGVTPERFEVVASFVSHQRAERLRARVQVPADDPTIDSLYAIYPGTDFHEREVFDLFGITFAGHPDQSRILMPETWEGHPLRKDYAVGAIPVQFKAPWQRNPKADLP